MASSPAFSRANEFPPNGLHQIVQHNSSTSYPEGQYEFDEAIHLQSNFGSPPPASYHSQQPRHVYQHRHHDSGLGFSYDDYNTEYQESAHQDRYSTPATSPPTSSIGAQDTLRTRSGRGIQRNLHALRPMPEGRRGRDKSPKPKKAKKEKIKAEKKVAKLDRPLSELTKDWTHVPVVDIEAYVNRSAEERQKEVEKGKAPGKVKRPMNSFMLYRKAYQNRTKDWCLQNNHQVVSQVCGDSWPMEPEEVREQFNEWARIERINHQNAHPGYKFTPTKPGTIKAGKRKQSEDFSDESDLSDVEWREPRSNKRSNRSRSAGVPQIIQTSQYPTSVSAYQYSSRETTVEPSYSGYNKSSYHVTNPGKPVPAEYHVSLQPGEYYQQTIRQNPRIVGAEDLFLRKTAVPGGNDLHALPGGHQQQQDFNMMNGYALFDNQQVHLTNGKFGHSLMPQSHDAFPGIVHTGPGTEGVYMGDIQNHDDQKWDPSHFGLVDPSLVDPLLFRDPEQRRDSELIRVPHMDVLKGNHEGWHIETLSDGGHFENSLLDEEQH